MNNKEFLLELARRLEMNQKEVSRVSNVLVKEMSKILEEENTIALSGFGSFEVKKKLERVVVNPSTKLRMLVPPKLYVSFKVASALKEKVNEK